MSLDLLVEEFRSNAHLVHQGDSKTGEWKKAAETMNDLWLRMNESQRQAANKGYEWMWVPPDTDK